jgi:hypothetical protein
MRAAEFMRALADIIEKLDGEESSESQTKNPEEKDPNPVMVPPLQQELELAKAEQGKESPVIDKMTQDDNIGSETKSADDSLLQAIKQLVSR